MNLTLKKLKLSGADIFFIVVCIGLFTFLWNQRYEIIYDEFFIKEALTPLTTWPAFSRGIVSILIVKLLGFICHPQPEHLLGDVKSIAGLFYITGPYLTLRTLTKNEWARVGGLVLLISSCYPFLWLSSELFGAGFLSLALYFWVSRKPFALTGVFLGLFSFSKPDFILIGVGLLFFISIIEKNRQDRRNFILSFFVIAMVLNIPGVVENGFHRHFNQDRAGDSFIQHFAALVALFQIAPHPDPWMNIEPYRAALIPRAHTFTQALFYYPNIYLKFALLSLYEGIKNVLIVFHVLLLFCFLPLFYKGAKKVSPQFDKVLHFFLVSLIGLVPAILCSYPVTRYFGKYYPLVMLTAIGYCESRPVSSKARKVSWIFFTFCVIVQLVVLVRRFDGMDRYTMFWMRD